MTAGQNAARICDNFIHSDIRLRLGAPSLLTDRKSMWGCALFNELSGLAERDRYVSGGPDYANTSSETVQPFPAKVLLPIWAAALVCPWLILAVLI